MADNNKVIVELGRVIKNRREYNPDASPLVKYFEENIVQKQGNSYIAYPTALVNDGVLDGKYYLTRAPFDADPQTPNAGWEVFASGKHNFKTGEDIEDVSIATGSDFTNPDATKRAKVPTVGAILDGLNDGIYDVSKRNPTAGPNSDGKFTLEYILNNANTLISTSWRHGGMIISFVHTFDNKYVQYRYMGTEITGNPNPFLDTANWQGVDSKPVAGSYNLVDSEGVFSAIVSDNEVSFDSKVGLTIYINYSQIAAAGISNKIGYYNNNASSGVYIKISLIRTNDSNSKGHIFILNNEDDIVSGTNVEILYTIDYGSNYMPTFYLPAGKCLCVSYEDGDTLNMYARKTIQEIDLEVKKLKEGLGSKLDFDNVQELTSIQKKRGINNLGIDIDSSVTADSKNLIESGAVYNGQISSLLSSTKGVKERHNSVNSLTTISTFNLRAGLNYQLRIILDSAVPSGSLWVNRLYKANGDTIISANVAGGQTVGISTVFDCVEDLNGVVFKSENKVDFTWEIIVSNYIDDGAVTTPKIAKNAVKIEKIDDYTKSLLLEGFLGSSSTDYNSYISECYIDKSYLNSGEIYVTLRKWNNGIIVRAFYDNSHNTWYLNDQNIFDNRKNGDIIPFVVTSAGGSASVGDTIGYIVFKDIDGFKALSNDSGNGQKFVLEFTTKLFTQGKIWMLLSGAIGIVPDNSVTTPKIGDKAVTLAKTSKTSLYEGMYISLPSTIYAVVGDKLQIFFHSIVHCANPVLFDVIAICAKGKSYPRYWEYTPSSEDAGTLTNITIRVRDNALQTIVEKTVTIQFINIMSTPSTNKNVLCIGASATANGVWVGELRRRLTENTGDGTPANPIGLGLSNITFVGRKNGTTVNVPLEATGGWKVQSYGSAGETAFRLQVTGVNQLNIGDEYTSQQGGGVFVLQEINVTEGVGNLRFTFNSAKPTIPASGTITRISGSGDSTITYTSYAEETFSPFWNDSLERLDFTTYANDWCNGSIDIMIWHCGVNDIFIGTDVAITNVINAFKEILRQYHTDFPSGKVIISSVPICSLNGGMSANYGASDTYNILTFSNAARKYAIALSELCTDNEFSSFTIYASVLEEFDAENGYPATDRPVNNRLTTVTEKLGTNGVHPTEAGSLMVADSVYRTFNII